MSNNNEIEINDMMYCFDNAIEDGEEIIAGLESEIEEMRAKMSSLLKRSAKHQAQVKAMREMRDEAIVIANRADALRTRLDKFNESL
jgi:predicted  nucleic acid-binding Zn-ribbon protein